VYLEYNGIALSLRTWYQLQFGTIHTIAKKVCDLRHNCWIPPHHNPAPISSYLIILKPVMMAVGRNPKNPVLIRQMPTQTYFKNSFPEYSGNAATAYAS